MLFFSSFLLSFLSFSFAGCLPPLLLLWCGECAGACCTAVVSGTTTGVRCPTIFFILCLFFAPRLTAPPGVWCRAGDAWSAGTRHGTLRRCRRVWEAFPVLLFIFYFDRSPRRSLRVWCGSWSFFFSFSFLFEVVLYPMFFFCFFVGSCMPGFETTGSPSFFFQS